MRFPFYSGTGSGRGEGAGEVFDVPRRADQTRPESYRADQGLVDAANVAILLGQPLLLTGEPGTGKTQFAHSLAWELGLGEPLVFETKSTSAAADLFYHYDALGRFHAAQAGEAGRRTLDYLNYRAMGVAILRANAEADVAALLPDGFRHGGPRRSVVLVDEVDKAPRDFPNDLLNEVEGMFFRVPELGNVTISAGPESRPILVLTSNSEKHLPDAFLRRCIYYHIPFPDRERLAEIVLTRLGREVGGNGDFLSEALDLFFQLRHPTAGLRKRPTTAELLSWLVALRAIAPDEENPLAGSKDAALRTLSSLVKTAEDHALAREVVAGRREDRVR